MILESGRSPGGGNGNLLQYSYLGNLTDRGAWWAIVHRAKELNMTEVTEHACLLTHQLGNLLLNLTKVAQNDISIYICIILIELI